MRSPAFSRLLAYGAIAGLVLFVGARWVDADARARTSQPDQGTGAGGRVAKRSAASGPTVHIAGAVRSPGLYDLRPGSRVADAVKRAGGALGRADLDAINLAAPLTDGQQVVVPAGASAATAATAGSASAPGLVSLGSATQADLEQIAGIGPVTAAKIIETRDSGGAAGVDDLDAVPGIGPATMESLRAALGP